VNNYAMANMAQATNVADNMLGPYTGRASPA
jgi:hypothetical protein